MIASQITLRCLKSPASWLFAQPFIQDQRKPQSSASLAFVIRIHRWLMDIYIYIYIYIFLRSYLQISQNLTHCHKFPERHNNLHKINHQRAIFCTNSTNEIISLRWYNIQNLHDIGVFKIFKYPYKQLFQLPRLRMTWQNMASPENLLLACYALWHNKISNIIFY